MSLRIKNFRLLNPGLLVPFIILGLIITNWIGALAASEYPNQKPIIILKSPLNGAKFILGSSITVIGQGTYCHHIAAFINNSYDNASYREGNYYSYTFTPSKTGTYSIYLKARNTLDQNASGTMENFSQTITFSVVELAKPTPTPPPAQPGISGLQNPITVTKGDQFRLSGSVTCKDTITAVSLGISGVKNNWQRATPNSTSFSLSSFELGTEYFSSAGSYTITIWASTTRQGGIQIGQVTVNVKEAPPAQPGISGLQNPITVTKGDQFRLSGSVTCKDTITAVSLGISGVKDNWQRATPNSTRFNLSSFNLGTEYFSTAGSYTITIWVSTARQGGIQIGQVTVNVKEASIAQPTISGLLGLITVNKGESFRLHGIVKCNDSINKVTLGVLGNSVWKTTHTPNSTSYDLSNFILKTGMDPFPEAKSYTITIWAETNKQNGVKVGELTVTVKEVLSPKVSATPTVKPTPTPPPSKPTITGLSKVIMVNKGDSFKILGFMKCNDDIQKISLGILGQSGVFMSVLPQSREVDLSQCFSIDTRSGILSQAGTYTITIWAATTRLDGNQIGELDRVTVTVKEVLLPKVSATPTVKPTSPHPRPNQP